MSAVLLTVLPVFFLIALGYLAARLKLLPASAANSLGQFVFFFAIPAILFKTMAELSLPDGSVLQLWAGFFLPAAVIWLISVMIARRNPALRVKGGAVAAITASFGNLLMLGLPLTISFFGPKAALPAALIISIHSPLQWLAAMMLAHWSERGDDVSLSRTALSVLLSQLRHPITVSVIIGLLWAWSGVDIHPVLERTIAMLSAAAIPAALFALGLSLAQFGLISEVKPVAVLLAVKLVLFPLITAVFVTTIIDLPPVWAAVAVTLAAMPAGANAYLFSQQYNAGIGFTSSAIALGTALSLITVPVVLWWLS